MFLCHLACFLILVLFLKQGYPLFKCLASTKNIWRRYHVTPNLSCLNPDFAITTFGFRDLANISTSNFIYDYTLSHSPKKDFVQSVSFFLQHTFTHYFLSFSQKYFFPVILAHHIQSVLPRLNKMQRPRTPHMDRKMNLRYYKRRKVMFSNLIAYQWQLKNGADQILY